MYCYHVHNSLVCEDDSVNSNGECFRVPFVERDQWEREREREIKGGRYGEKESESERLWERELEGEWVRESVILDIYIKIYNIL